MKNVITQSAYARKIRKSRSFVKQEILKGNIETVEVNNVTLIKTKSHDNGESLQRNRE